MGRWWKWALVRSDGVTPSRMVGVSASVNLPLHHKVQKFSSGTGSPGWYRKNGRKTVVVVVLALHTENYICNSSVTGMMHVTIGIHGIIVRNVVVTALSQYLYSL